jgi:hypothetical protein
MNGKKLRQLFESARQAASPVPPQGFAAGVLRAAGREPVPESAGSISLLDHLNSLFPRVALAAMALIILCALAEFGLTASSLPGVEDGASQVSSQYFFNVEDL